MFKFSWGTIAAIFYLSFVMFMIGMVTLAMREKFELVTPDYYAQELKYQQKIDAVHNTNALREATKVTLGAKVVTIDLPKDFDGKKIIGQVYFFRPSEVAKDVTFNLNIDENGIQTFKSEKFINGMYRIKIDWHCEGKDYFVEQPIFLKN